MSDADDVVNRIAGMFEYGELMVATNSAVEITGLLCDEIATLRAEVERLSRELDAVVAAKRSTDGKNVALHSCYRREATKVERLKSESEGRRLTIATYEDSLREYHERVGRLEKAGEGMLILFRAPNNEYAVCRDDGGPMGLGDLMMFGGRCKAMENALQHDDDTAAALGEKV